MVMAATNLRPVRGVDLCNCPFWKPRCQESPPRRVSEPLHSTVLRGMALSGMFVVHFHNLPRGGSRLGSFIQSAIALLVESKGTYDIRHPLRRGVRDSTSSSPDTRRASHFDSSDGCW